jgi:hypothetical protein
MSLFDDASLVYIPTGYKPTKNYSGKPSTGGADMTFSRASGATRVNSRGLIEKVRTNLILQSNSFDTTWGNNNTSETGGQSGYDGSSNAWLLNSTASFGSITQSFTAINGVCTLSIYAKAGTNDWILLRMNAATDARAWFDLSNGVLGSSDGPTIESKIQSVGGGWYRCSVSANVSVFSEVLIYPTNADTVVGSAGNIIIQNAQLETGDIATNYIETTSAAVSVGPVNDEPRLTYDPVNPTAPSLLMEPQRTNLNTYSEAFDNSAWGKVSATITANTTISPDGYQNADTFTTSASGARIFQTLSLGAGTYTASLYVKKLSGSGNMRFFGVVDGSGVTQSFTPTDEWQRFTGNFTASTGITEIQLRENGFTGTLAIYGFQLELGSYATSYIPTNGTSVTRVADASFKTGIGSLLSASEYTLYWEGTHIPTGQYNSFMTIYKASDLNSSARFYRNNTNNEIRAAIFDSVSGLSLDLGSGVTTQTAKCALRVKAGDYALYVNGNLVNSNTNALAPSSNLDAVNLQYFDSSQSFDQKTGQVLFFKTALSNATLATLTSL